MIASHTGIIIYSLCRKANYLRCLDLRRGCFVETGPLYYSYCEYKIEY